MNDAFRKKNGILKLHSMAWDTVLCVLVMELPEISKIRQAIAITIDYPLQLHDLNITEDSTHFGFML